MHRGLPWAGAVSAKSLSVDRISSAVLSVRVLSMMNKMVRFVGTLSSSKPIQIFMVGSIFWVINADGDGEIIEPVQIDSASTTPAPATADPISELPPRSSSPTTRRLLPRYSRKHVDNNDLIASIDQVG